MPRPRSAAELGRLGNGPVVITAKTFRMGGHATHDEGESRKILPREDFVYWGKRDPIGMYETYLGEADLSLSNTLSNYEALEQAEREVEAEVDDAAQDALESVARFQPDPAGQALGVFAPTYEEKM